MASGGSPLAHQRKTTNAMKVLFCLSDPSLKPLFLPIFALDMASDKKRLHPSYRVHCSSRGILVIMVGREGVAIFCIFCRKRDLIFYQNWESLLMKTIIFFNVYLLSNVFSNAADLNMLQTLFGASHKKLIKYCHTALDLNLKAWFPFSASIRTESKWLFKFWPCFMD